MCVFSGPVRNVSNTRIFVTELKSGDQFTVYQNAVAFAANSKRVAMILPFPNPNGTITAYSQIMWNMSEYKNFFKHCNDLFPMPVTKGISSRSTARSKSSVLEPLPIFQCGAYEYSVVSNFDEFSALNFAQFNLEPKSISLLTLLKRYYGTGYGFLVCIYTQEGEIPPIAFIHPKLPNGKLFVPTMHDHHGNETSNALANWSHEIYILNNATFLYSHGTMQLINPTSLNAEIEYRASLSGRWNELEKVFDYTKLPPGFPTHVTTAANATTPDNCSAIARLQIEGFQKNGDLAFISSLDFASCYEKHECTFRVTSTTSAYQPLFACENCFPPRRPGEADLGCFCSVCVGKCEQANHKIRQLKPGSGGFCDTPFVK